MSKDLPSRATERGTVMGQRFTGKSVVITGAGAGIGLGYAHAFAAEGALVTIADLDAAAAGAAAGAVQGSLAVTVDVADEASVEAMVAATSERFGGVDILAQERRAAYGHVQSVRRPSLGRLAGGCSTSTSLARSSALGTAARRWRRRGWRGGPESVVELVLPGCGGGQRLKDGAQRRHPHPGAGVRR